MLQIYSIYTNWRVETICASQKVQAQELVIDRKRENDYSKLTAKRGRARHDDSTRAERRRSIVHYLKENWVFYLFILPAFLDILIFWYFPLYGIQISFRDYKIRRGMTGSEWVGLEYFVQFIESPNFVQLMRNTLRFPFIICSLASRCQSSWRS